MFWLRVVYLTTDAMPSEDEMTSWGERAMAQSGEAGSARAMEIWLAPFAAMFTQPSWLNAVALATGALLCLNRRTVCAALRAVDGASDKGFSRFHRFLSRGAWSGLQRLEDPAWPAGEGVRAGRPAAGGWRGRQHRTPARRQDPRQRASTVIRCGQAAASSSRSRVCAGCRCRCWPDPVSPGAPGDCRS